MNIGLVGTSKANALAGGRGQIAPVEAFAYQRFDHSLTADVEPASRVVQLREHLAAEIHVHSLDRRHHPAVVREELRDVLVALSTSCDLVGAHDRPFRGLGLTSFLSNKGAPKGRRPLRIRFLSWGSLEARRSSENRI